MNSNEWDELFKLRDKAGLTPKINNQLSRLEDFIAYDRYLKTYTQEEKDSFINQLNELSDEEKQELWIRATNRTHSGFFHLTNEEVEKLGKARKSLSFHERARLLQGLIRTAAGTAWLDLGEVFNANIEIDDRSSLERESRPYAHIYFSDFSKAHVETIDILESIRNNLTALGHPAIMFAIYHWQRVIYMRRVIEREDATSRDEWGRFFKEEYRGGRDVRSATNNLKAISETLYDYAEKRAIPLESAFALRMQQCGLLGPDEKNTLVYKAWDILNSEFFNKAGAPKKVLENLESELLSLERVSQLDGWAIYTSRVMEFLNGPGSKFTWFDENGNSPRRKWVGFRNAFAAWYFDLAQTSVQHYLEKASKQNVVVDELYEPSMIYPTTTVYRILHYLFENPLTAAREPVVVNDRDIELGSLEAAIVKALTSPE